jgi:hypothetical protein
MFFLQITPVMTGNGQTGAGVAQARPVTGLIFRVDALVMRLFGSLFSFQAFYSSVNKIPAAHYQTWIWSQDIDCLVFFEPYPRIVH